MKVCILRMEGTNCEEETYHAFYEVGAKPEFVHLKKLARERNLFDYDCLIIPGGFSSGDYVRAGAIFAARIRSELGNELRRFVEEGYPVGGICNGFQVLVELGLLPGINQTMGSPTAVLAVNDSARFECRPSLLKHENVSVFTRKIPLRKILEFPSAHAEGKLILREGELEEVIRNRQIIFRYVDPDGRYAGYPWNPNGSVYNIAALSNPGRNVVGIMPHPERVFHPWTHHDRKRRKKKHGDGRAFFESVLGYLGYLCPSAKK